jgi:hypothetical protein
MAEDLVRWFNGRQIPDSFFEVEHTTDNQNSPMKFYEMLKTSQVFVV